MFTKYLKFWVLVVFTPLFSCNNKCPEKEVKALMGNLYEQHLQMPDLELINGNTLGSNNRVQLSNLSPVKYYVVHYFQADCDKCINELKSAQIFITQHTDFNNVKFIFIADGPTKIYAQAAIKELSFKFPVFYEKTYEDFKKTNRFPIGDNLYNTLLMNNKKQLILVGSLFDNEKAQKLYFAITNGCPVQK